MATTSGMMHRFGSSGSSADEGRALRPEPPAKTTPDEFAYRLELWDEGKNAIETILAMASSGTIAYAAYYAATREFPERYVTLRHGDNVLSRWNAPGH